MLSEQEKYQQFITTFTGKKYYLYKPSEVQINIDDIANGLSIETRFNNCCPVVYTVLQHSIYACEFAPDEYKLEGLLHDWTEAYLKDIPKPLKNLLPDYLELETKHEIVGATKFKLAYPYPNIIKEIDKRLAVTEALCLIGQRESFYLYKGIKPFDINIRPINRTELIHKFMRLYNELRRV